LFILSKPRLCSGFLTAIVSGSLAFTFLEPLFVPVGMELAVVALWILSLNAAAVGACLGVLLPKITPGACCGVALSLLIGCLATLVNPMYFPAASGGLAIVGAVLSAW
jgi:callose synthase